ncbi:MAG: oxygen-independent coproporphyrinogen III oxidase [Pseudomonadota bacterium]
MSTRLQAYATRAVPRYTSYPTAPHFSDRVHAGTYAGWLQALDPADPISVYLHVPFCRQLCWYCGCNMKLASKDAPIAQYADTLEREIELVSGLLPGRMTVSHLHWGGGTPTALSPSALTRLMENVADRFDFAPEAELAIESDPRTLTPEMIRTIGGLGFTRASFGVQEFDPTVQLAINRVQPPDMVRVAVDGLREAGITGINFDLIYGLPHQTVETLTRTIALCAEMRPDRVALFGYAHVPWMAKKQRLIDEAALPGPDERLAQSRSAAEALLAAGYVAIGLDHFALPHDPLAIAAQENTLRRNFQGYTTDTATTMLGLGATSIGRTPDGYFQNISETRAWSRAVEAGALPVAKGIALSEEDKLRGWVIEALMCRGQVNLEEAGARFGTSRDWHADLDPELARMEVDGVIVRRGTGHVEMAQGAQQLVRTVAAVFDTYLRKRHAGHSVAV